jgi:hypothetical protein
MSKVTKLKKYCVKFKQVNAGESGWNIDQYVDAPNKTEAKNLAWSLVKRDFSHINLELISCEEA